MCLGGLTENISISIYKNHIQVSSSIDKSIFILRLGFVEDFSTRTVSNKMF